MDVLSQAYNQVVDLFKSMTPAGRLTTGLLLAVVVVSLVFLFYQQSDQADEYLFGGQVLSQSEINAMLAAFSQKGLKAEVEGGRVRVPRAKSHEYLLALADAQALPRTPTTAWDTVFERDSPLKSKHMRELEARRAQERTLADTIEDIPTIDVARVQIEEIEVSGFPRRAEKRSLVSAKAEGTQPLDPQLVETIRYMVASGGGVDSKNVTVTDLNTGQAYPGSGDNGHLLDNLYAKHQRSLEENLKAKIVDRLSMYPGVRVAVHVELDEEMVNQTVSNQYDDKPTTIETTDFSKEVTSTRGAPGGRPGVVPNATISNVPQQLTSMASNESTTTERSENQRSVTGTTHMVTERIPFMPKWMGVSIGIPRSHFERVWRQQNPPAEGTEPPPPDPTQLKAIESEIVKDIEDAVTPLLPKVALGEDPYPRVSVIPYTPTALPAPEEPSLANTAVTWLGSNWQNLGLLGLALLSIVVLRGMLRSSPQSDDPIQRTLPVEQLVQHEDEEAGDEADEVENSLKARFKASGRNLRDDLTELVREDPDAAANVLQAWIGDAA
jgi:flagellar M-ring protein FliF